MLGAISGDIIGSIYEWNPIKITDFVLFGNKCDYTDDTVLTVAIAYSILENVDYAVALKRFGNNYTAGYGSNFYNWLQSPSYEPYNSWGNGSAMRVSPVGFAFDSVETVLEQAKKSAEVTHNHPEGIKGAQAVALAIYLARTGADKEVIKKEISNRFDYNLERSLEEIRPSYVFEVSCQKSVPESIIAFLESNNFEESIRNAISLGGDSDTMACIAGSIAEAFYQQVPEKIVQHSKQKLPDEFLKIIDKFYKKYRVS
ncbi:MAG: ADP-ribosylglycohydrolase family protein [Methylococcaceae bacterium]|nr:ADP-ribosylglycohydrolase family protein [Methylococcaceae bacterium]